MHRYLAILKSGTTDARDGISTRLIRQIHRSSTSWSVAYDHRGLLVFQAGAVPGRWMSYTLSDRGVVLGSLFRRVPTLGHAASPNIGEGECSAIIESAGARIVDLYWGRYVAFLTDEDERTRRIIRDPTGAVPCFFLRLQAATYVFSHMQDCLELLPVSLNIDWRHIRAFLYSDRLIDRSTGYEEIRQVLPGECMTLTPDATKQEFYWNPHKFCSTRRSPSVEEARIALHEAITASVQSWASCYSKVLHGLSGGLDSSIVLSCLARAPLRPNVVCMNIRTETPEGDERHYARLAAKSAGCELVETVIKPLFSMPGSYLQASHAASPAFAGFASENDEVQARVVSEHGCEAIFSGQGGDHLFQERISGLVPAEYLGDHGPRAKFLSTALQTAHATGRSIWSILQDALRYCLFPRNFDPYEDVPVPSFLCGDLDAIREQDIRHPWVDEDTSIAAVKREQIFAVVDCQVRYAISYAYADTVHPLISQPIIECALQIPSYVLSEGGRTRALVRGAFAAEVPGEIIKRTNKGGASGYFHNIVHDRAGALREFLLDGHLIREGIVKKQVLEQELRELQLVRGSQPLFAMMTLIRTEGWLREAILAKRSLAA